MSRRIISLADGFVAELGIMQTRVPVDLTVLHNRFVPVYEDLTSLKILGYGMFPLSGDVTVYQPARITIDESLSSPNRRLVYVHELGHYIAGHTSTPATVALNDWMGNRHEREAWLAGITLLLPPLAIEEDETVDAFARRAGVPIDLARVYWKSLGLFS